MKRGTSSFPWEIMLVTLRKLKPCHTRLGNQNQEWKNTKCPTHAHCQPHRRKENYFAWYSEGLPGIQRNFCVLKGEVL